MAAVGMHLCRHKGDSRTIGPPRLLEAIQSAHRITGRREGSWLICTRPDPGQCCLHAGLIAFIGSVWYFSTEGFALSLAIAVVLFPGLGLLWDFPSLPRDTEPARSVDTGSSIYSGRLRSSILLDHWRCVPTRLASLEDTRALQLHCLSRGESSHL